MTPASNKLLSVLYLLAGRPRQGDMTDCLHQLASGHEIRMACVDIQRRPSVDLAKSKEREKLLARIRAKEFHARDTAIASLLYLLASAVVQLQRT